jgi:uncharacterized protein DUF5996
MTSPSPSQALRPLPPLPLASWKDTYATLHRWTQIVGKVRMALAPPVNHWWNVTLYPTARGLTTSPMPCGERALEIEFDFLVDTLVFRTSDGATRRVPLTARSVADFHADVVSQLADLGVRPKMRHVPDEIGDATPFAEDRVHASYDADAARRHWRILLWSACVMDEFRARFVGKCSPVHFFWGAFDLAVTRFSGRRAPQRPENGPVEREAYSHEVISAGFWPGDETVREPSYYCYAHPAQESLASASVRPESAYWHPQLGQFLLPYDAVRASSSPREALLEFLQSTYDVAAEASGWDRESLERAPEADTPATRPL